jgi:exonuclease III
MKILAWNCRGLTRPAAVRSLRMLIRDNSPDLLFLSKTKASPSQVSAILNSLGFFFLSQVLPIGSSGGLVLSWRPGIDLECFITNKHNISAWIFSDPSSPWIISCLYGPPNKRDKPAFWDSLKSVGDGFAAP